MTPTHSRIAVMAFVSLLLRCSVTWSSMTQGASFLGLCSCYFNTDTDFYVIDLSRQGLMYRFKMFFYERYTLAAPFSQIAFVSVDGIQRSTKSRIWWEYALIICLKDGRLFPVSDYTEAGWKQAEDIGPKLGQPGDCTVFSGRIHSGSARVLRQDPPR